MKLNIIKTIKYQDREQKIADVIGTNKKKLCKYQTFGKTQGNSG